LTNKGDAKREVYAFLIVKLPSGFFENAKRHILLPTRRLK